MAQATQATQPLPSTTELTPEVRESLRARALGDLYIFAKGVLGFDKLTPHIHQPLCRLLELYNGHDDSLGHPWSTYCAVLEDTFRRAGVPHEEWEGRLRKIRRVGIKRLAILLPRTWFKTTLVSIAYSLWRATRDPDTRICLLQNTFTNSKAKGSAIAQLVDGCQLYKLLFPEVLPTSRERWCDEARCLKRPGSFAESTFEFAGTGTQLTSRHYNVIIEDDTVAPDKDDLGEDAILPNSVDVAQAIGMHRLIPPLLVDMQEDQDIVVGTRWFELDLLKWVMDNEKHFIVYQRAVREDSIGRPDVRGAITYPERFNESVLEELAAAMGPYLYSCLYMNMPIRAGQMKFKPEWMKDYLTEPQGLMVFTTVDGGDDPAETKGTPDFTVVMSCGKDMRTGHIYVLAYDREQCSPGRTIELIFQHQRLWNPVVTGLQGTHYERQLKYWIKERMRETGVYFNIKELKHPKRDKGHIAGLQPLFANGVILLRPHMDALRNELLVFPLGKTDDVADTLGMQLELWRVTPNAQKEKAQRGGGPCDLETCVAAARGAGEEAERVRIHDATTPRPAWGQSIPVAVFHGPGGEADVRHIELGSRWQ